MSTNAKAVAPATSSKGEIRPFRVEFSKASLDDLRNRIRAARFSEKETVTDFSQGTPLATLESLTNYWISGYDLDNLEARLNAYPQFITEIDGLDIHYIHVKSKEAGAMPMILAHGWPGSAIELMKLIGPLTDPVAHGGKASDAFDVVIPSMPGYGFSGKPDATGWGPERIAKAWITLMKRLGYKKFTAQGGDWGAVIVDLMALEGETGLLAIHTNMPGAVPARLDKAAAAGEAAPDGLSAEERHAYDQLAFTYGHVYYAYYMASRPQTLAALADSPVGLAAFLLDHDGQSLKLIARVFEGKKEGLTRQDILDNISMYWLTNTGVSASRLYRENKFPYFSQKGVTIPVAVSAFPDELFQCPRSWAEEAYPNLIFYNKPDKGGHFAAWEQPQYFVEDLRMAFRPLR